MQFMLIGGLPCVRFDDYYDCQKYETDYPWLFVNRIGWLYNINGYENGLLLQDTIGM